jgi:GTP cyclohydrolase I
MIIKETLSYEKVELYDTETTDSIAENYTSIIRNLGEDVNREGILSTPVRAAKAMQYLTHGYGLDPLEILKSALFTEDHRQMIVVKDIEVYSMCEHHMLLFSVKHNIPNGQIVGLSKIPRIVDAFARRMQVQERLTDQIKTVFKRLNPLGVAVVIANNTCVCR